MAMATRHLSDLARSSRGGRSVGGLCGGRGVGSDGDVLAIRADAVLDVAVGVAVGQRLGGGTHGQQQPEQREQASARHGEV